MKQDKRYVGMLYSVIINGLFIGVALWSRNFFSGATWYFFSSAHRLLFGIVATAIYCKLYSVTWKQVFCFRNWKIALVAGSGFLLYATYYVVTICVGVESIVGLTMPLLISQIFLQQITTGFYEEITCRGLFLGGYFEQENNTWKCRLLYALGSFVLFGVIHVVGGGSFYTFLFTGCVGFAFATIYLKSHNILIPMLLHFVYDIFANLSGYIEFNDTTLFQRMNAVFDIVVVVMFIVSVILLVREDWGQE